MHKLFNRGIGLLCLLSSVFSLFCSKVFAQDPLPVDTTLTGLYYSSSDWGDYDNDGDLDLIVAGLRQGGSPGTILYTNNGMGAFTANNPFSGLYHSAVAWGDYNNDGFLDLIISGTDDNTTGFTLLYTNNRNGSFTLNSNASASFEGVFYSAVVWGDIDNDGDADLIISGKTSTGRSTKVYENKGDGTFGLKQSLTGVEQSSLSFADYDNDGDLDLMLTGTTNGSNSGRYGELYQNTNGTFTQINVFLDSNREVIRGETDWGDYDNDGDLDLVISGAVGSSKQTNLYKNTNGSFSLVTADSDTLIDVENSSVSFGDYDGDSDLDLIVSGLSGSGRVTRLYENNGGSFTTNTDHNIEASAVGSLIWVDYNNDGKLDLSQTGYGVSVAITKLYKNSITTTSGPGLLTGVTAGFNKSVNPDSIIFSWDEYNDVNNASASIDYNLYLVNETNPDTLIFAMADTTTGFRRTISPGNVGRDTSSFKFAIPDDFSFRDTYRFGVQAIDLSLRQGGFSSKTFKFKGFIEDTTQFFTNVTEGAVAWGDYDSDGDLDLVKSGYSSSLLITEVYENDGSGGLTKDTGINLTGVYLSSVDWGDYDNDGDLDLVISGDAFSGKITEIYENDGNGGLTKDMGINLTGVSSGSVDWGDYDNDGDLDLVISGYSSSLLITEVYENDGSGGLTKDTGVILPGVNYSSVAWGDYDNDGDLDLVISGLSSSGRITEVYENDGSGGLTKDTGINLTGVNYSSVAWGDYDNDGDLDLVISGLSSSGRTTEVYENDGSGGLTKDTGINLTGVYLSSVDWGDYDNDGDLDLVISGDAFSGKITEIYENDGNGGLTKDMGINLTGVSSGSVDWGDYDNDGDLDLVITGLSSDGSITEVYENFGYENTTYNSQTYQSPIIQNATVDPETDTLTVQIGTVAVAGRSVTHNVYIASKDDDAMFAAQMADTLNGYRRVAALGNMGYNDTYKIDINALPIGNYVIGVQEIETNFEGGPFSTFNFTKVGLLKDTTKSNTFTNLSGSSLAWGDYDNDGDLDLAISGTTDGSTGFTAVYENDGTGNFTENTSLSLTGVYQSAIEWADYDNDGDIDLLISGFDGSDEVTILYKNDGSGGLTDSGIQLPDIRFPSFAWNDFDLDGDLDLAISGTETGGSNGALTRIYLNNNQGGLTESGLPLRGVYNSAMEWADYNNDGFADLLVTGYVWTGSYSTFSTLYKNNGAGGFSDSLTNVFPDVEMGDINWGDYDDDGDLDVIITGTTQLASSTAVTEHYSNDGDGTFTKNNTNSSTLINAFKASLASADYDNDGDIDVVISGQSGSSPVTKLYLNNNGVFTETVSDFTAVEDGDLAWADVNADGELDLIVTGSDNSDDPVTELYTSIINEQNTAPTLSIQDVMLSINSARDSLIVAWNDGSDAENGPLSYNVHIQNVDVSEEYKLSSVMADLTNGYRRIPKMGNAGIGNEYKIGLLDHPVGTYQVRVQAIDAGFKSSSLHETESIVFSPVVFTVTDTSFVLYKDETNLLPLEQIFSITDYFTDSTMVISSESPSSGLVFLDLNNDSTKNEGEKFLTEAGIEFPPPLGATFRYNQPDSYGLDSLKLYLTGTVNQNVNPDSTVISLQIFEGTPTISGNANENGWYLLSNPFQTTIGELMDSVWTQGAINSDAPSGAATLYRFSQDSAKYIPITGDIDADTLDPGEGLLAFIFEDDTPADNAEVNGGWPKTLTNFGNPFGEQVSIPIKNVDVNSSGGTSGSEGFKLFGNPFGWDLSVDSLITALVEIDPLTNRYVYRWNPISKEYELEFSGGIKPYESVFIRTITSGLDGSINLEYDDIYEVTPIKLVPTEPFELILTNSSHNLHSTSVLQFNEENASVGIDPFDGYYLGSYASKYANLYTQVYDQSLTINNLPVDLNEIVEFPIYLDATVSGDFDLNWNKELLPEGWTFSLEEVATGTVIDLKKQDQLSFSNGVQAKVKKTGEQENTSQTDKVSDEEGDKVLRLEKNKSGLDVEASKINEEEDSKPTNMTRINAALKSKIKSSGTEPVLILTINPLTSTGNESDLGLPTVVELDQNYPNPFNPTSIIRFGVPNTAKVQLEVFDILGRKVATLVNNETKQPGRYNAQFDARNLASGMYIYRLVIGDKVLTKRMTLIK